MSGSRTRRTVERRTLRTQNIDVHTGEVLNGTMVLVPEKKKSAFGRNWFAMSQGALDFLASSRKILGEEGFAVFCKLVARLDFENFIQVNQAALAREISMSPSNFSRALKKLVDLELIIKGPKEGASRTYSLNPSVGWKGSAKNHFIALQVARSQGRPAIDRLSASADHENHPLHKVRPVNRKRPSERDERKRSGHEPSVSGPARKVAS